MNATDPSLDEQRRLRRNEASARSRTKARASKAPLGDCSPSLGSEAADSAFEPCLGGAKARADDEAYALNRSIVYLNSRQVGHYGSAPTAYLPYAEFIKFHGAEALVAEMQAYVVTYHWDSGWLDDHKVGPKWSIIPYERWAPSTYTKGKSGFVETTDAEPTAAMWQRCTTELERRYPTFAATQELKRSLQAAYDEATDLRKGRLVRVVKGRKVEVGTEGTLIWIGEGYNPNRYRNGFQRPVEVRIGLKDSEGTVHWTSANNVEVVIDPEDLVY